MSPQVAEAVESARSASITTRIIRGVEPDRRHSFEMVRTLVLAVIRELPDEMMVSELRDELEDHGGNDAS